MPLNFESDDLKENSTWYKVIDEEQSYLIHLILTERCNLSCSYCYQNHHGASGIEYTRVRDSLFQAIRQRPDSDRVTIRYFGGEPLLRFADIRRLTEETNRLWHSLGRPVEQLRYGITTNGTLLNQEICDWLVEHPEVSLSLSLDGKPETQNRNRSNSYELVAPYLSFIRRYQTPVKMTISPESIGECADDLIHIHELGFECQSNIVFEDVWGEDEERAHYIALFRTQLAKLVDYYIDHPKIIRSTLIPPLTKPLPSPQPAGGTRQAHLCGIGENMTTISTDGQHHPCHRMLPLLKNADRNPDCNHRETMSSSICDQCPFSTMCPECRSYNLEYYGHMDHKTRFHCEFVQLQLRASALLTIHDIGMFLANKPVREINAESRIKLDQRLRTAEWIEHNTQYLLEEHPSFQIA